VPDYRDPFGDGFPGPYLALTVEWGGRTRELLALIDTGADLTQIPDVAAQALQLEQVEAMSTISSHGDTAERSVYVANLRFGGFDFPATWVVGDNYPIALIGRDVLNELIARFDGPARSFDLQRPNAAQSASS
jgi:predicted aspartyl protease